MSDDESHDLKMFHLLLILFCVVVVANTNAETVWIRSDKEWSTFRDSHVRAHVYTFSDTDHSSNRRLQTLELGIDTVPGIPVVFLHKPTVPSFTELTNDDNHVMWYKDEHEKKRRMLSVKRTSLRRHTATTTPLHKLGEHVLIIVGLHEPTLVVEKILEWTDERIEHRYFSVQEATNRNDRHQLELMKRLGISIHNRHKHHLFWYRGKNPCKYVFERADELKKALDACTS